METATNPKTFGDQFEGKLPRPLSSDKLREFSRLNPVVSCLGLVVEWGGVAAAVVLSELFWNPLLYVVAVMWIGARQHALAVLMHEGVHYRISKNRPFNDIVSEVFLAWPLFITMRGFRRHHFAHHRHTNTDDDPDWNRKRGKSWEFPKSKRELARMLGKDALGLSFYVHLAMVFEMSRFERGADGKVKKGELPFHLVRWGATLSLLGVFFYAGWMGEFFLYWIVPMFTWFIMIMHIRSISEHHALDYTHPYSHTRTTIPTLFDRLFLIPKNISFHIEHHLYPSVPFFRLPSLHRHLMENDEEFEKNAHVTRGYQRVLGEFCARTPSRSQEVDQRSPS